MAFAIALSDEQWELVADLFDPPGRRGVPIRPLVKIEHAFAQLGRWRRLSRCYEGSIASARTWLEVASVGYLAWRAAL
jgi:putative transposase